MMEEIAATEAIAVCYCGRVIEENHKRFYVCSSCRRLWGFVEFEDSTARITGGEWHLLIPNFPSRSRTPEEIKNQIWLCKRCNGPTEFIGLKHRVRCMNSFCQYEWYEASQGISLFENQLKHRRQEIQQKLISIKPESEEYAKLLQELIEIQKKAKAVKEEKL